VSIGIFWAIRIFKLKDFTTQDLDVFDGPHKPNKKTKMESGLFFLFHYNFFHLGYALFLLLAVNSPPDYKILLAGFIFFLNQLFSFWYTKDEKIEKKPDIGKLMEFPYSRIWPMHVIIVLALYLQNGAIEIEGETNLVFFLLLKTFADVSMYVKQRKGFSHEPKCRPD
jgi:hypothetical protein